MKNKNLKSILVTLMAMAMCVGLIGCAQPNQEVAQEEEGGVICLSVNPEIAIAYDGDGKVTELAGRNDDGNKILEAYEEFKDKQCREVAVELVEKIGEAGYFEPDAEGKINDVTITIEAGSILPSETFITDVAEDIRVCISLNKWHAPLNMEGESDYDMTDYVDTDYGVGNDGDSNYDDTDYGTGNDGVTDFGDAQSNYDVDSNYDAVTDYDDANSDYSNYSSNTSVNKPSAPAPAPTPAPTPAPAPSTGNNSDYGDSGYSNYSDYDSDSGYGDSDYDD